ncbi:hypothetical protein C8Q80DRAFT_1196778 [Daedaleopsis nitida]|nr:hypothetical protein C8Q80DRAFT_1196778 [Daedaleopsis nitida]
MSAVALPPLNPGDEDLAQLYHQVLAGFAEESPTGDHQAHHPTSPQDREVDSIYNHYQDGEGTPTANRLNPSARSAANCASFPLHFPLRSSYIATPLPRIPGSSPAPPVPPPPPLPNNSNMYGPGMPEARPYPGDELRHQPTNSSESGRYLPRAPSTNGYNNGLVNPPANSAMLPRLPSLNGAYVPDPRPGSSGPRPGSAESSSRGQYNMPVPDTSETYGWRSSSSEPRRPPLGAQPSKIPGYSPYNSVYEDDRPPSSPSVHEISDYRPYSQQSSSSLTPSPALHHSQNYSPIQALGRSTSTGSVGSLPYPSGLERNSSYTTRTTVSSTYQDSDGINRPSSSLATTVDRGNSVGSYVSKGSDGGWSTSTPPSIAPTFQQRPSQQSYFGNVDVYTAAPSMQPVASSSTWRDPDLVRTVQDIKRPLEIHDGYTEDDDEFYEEDPSEDGDDRFFNPALLSHIAVRLRDKVPRGTHVKGSIPYPRAFTGKDVVSTIQSQIQRELLVTHGISTNDRRAALQVARSLQSQLFFYEVEWVDRPLQDGVEDVYMFWDDQEGMSDARMEREELPTAVITLLTRCYASLCDEDNPCYSYTCPRRRSALPLIAPVEKDEEEDKNEWTRTVPRELLVTLPDGGEDV